jgi:5'-nucleotidase
MHLQQGKITIALSSRALFDLEKENSIYENKGTSEYEKYQIDHELDTLPPGSGFPLAKALLKLNTPQKKHIEVIVLSRNNPCVSLRIMNSIEKHGLDITRAVFTSGSGITKYLNAFSVSLYLSRNPEDVSDALKNDIAAGLLYATAKNYTDDIKEIRIAFDADAVIFSAESERVFKKDGLDAFIQHEIKNANRLLPEGPFANFLKTLTILQGQSNSEIKINLAIITARSSPTHDRIIKTLRAWNVRIDQIFFMGGIPKTSVIEAYKPHIFFDDQTIHCDKASKVAPTAMVITDYSQPIK